MAECGEQTGNRTISYPCTLTAQHKGPHMAVEDARSVRARAAYEQEAREAAAVLRTHQGPAQTFAEAWGEGPGTPVPGSDLQPAEYRAANPGSSAPPGRTPSVVTDEVITAPGEFEIRVWSDERDPGPYACPACGSVGTGSGMPGHLAEEHTMPEPTKQREGDQPLPEVNDRPSVQSLLIEDIERRVQVGIERYGTPLQAFNGRNAFLDAFEESLDQTTYLRQLMVERAEMAATMRRVTDAISTDAMSDDDFQALLGVMEWLEQ